MRNPTSARRARARATEGNRRERLAVAVTDNRGRPLRAAGLASWLCRVAPARASGAVNIALVDDAIVRQLNRRYRRKNYATDVLSFPPNPQSAIRNPQSLIPNRPSTLIPNPPSKFLGDIVIARGVAKRQARAAGHDELTELKILVLHGLLHLLGYDHESDGGRMLRVERRLRRKGGLREGLIERTRPASR